VVSHDRHELRGWITRQDVLKALAGRLTTSADEIERGAVAAGVGFADPEAQAHVPPTPLDGYRTVEIRLDAGSPALGRPLGELSLPTGAVAVAISEGREIIAARSEKRLSEGDRLIVLAPAPCAQPGPAAADLETAA
jgi:K+/H+ antiporter YhaU regulatory subunit KhtT